MPPALRTTLAIALLLGASSTANAGGRSASETFPTLATLPSGGPVSHPAAGSATEAPAATALSAAKAEGGGKGRGRRTRLARPDRVLPNPATLSAAAVQQHPDPAGSGPATPTTGREVAARTPDETRPAAGGAIEAAAPTLAALIAKHAAAAGVPVGLAQAVVRIESRGNAHAAHAGALGLMQIKAATARAAGFVGSASNLLDADTNLRFGMKVLGDAYRGSGGDVCRALMKYQSGHLATRMTAANRTYCTKARAIMAGA